jgi:hypothetical protein
MLTILGLTDKPCFICQKREGAAEVKFKDGTFTGVLCKEHCWERLDRPEKRAAGSNAAKSPVG